MDDHSNGEKLRSEIYREMSPARKWQEWKNLRNLAWKMKVAGVKAKHPSWTEQEVERAVKEIFLYAVT